MRQSTSLFPLIHLASHLLARCAQTSGSPEPRVVSWLVGLHEFIKVCCIITDTLLVLYNPEDESESTFIPHVQDIVKSLYQISQEIPSDAVTDVYNLGRDQSLRTTASLHLMLFQVCKLVERKNNCTDYCTGNNSYDSTTHATCRETHSQRKWPHRRTATCVTSRKTIEDLR